MTLNLKLNWYPVQVPNSAIELDAELVDRRQNFDDHTVRQYALDGKWLITNVAATTLTERFGRFSIECNKLPMLTSTLILNAVGAYFGNAGFEIDHGYGEMHAFKLKNLAAMPSTIRFYEGMKIKPFSTHFEDESVFGLVLDFATHQDFAQTLDMDKTQLAFATNGTTVKCVTGDFNRVSGPITNLTSTHGTVTTRSGDVEVSLANLKLIPSYQTIRDYIQITESVSKSREIVREMQIASFSLAPSGSRNLYRLANRHKRVSEFLGRDRIGNIGLRLPTLCQSIATLATECADVRLETS
jgi:hypothetical protein